MIYKPNKVIFADDVTATSPNLKTKGNRQSQDDPVFITHTSLSPTCTTGLFADSSGQAAIVDTETLKPIFNITPIVTPNHKLLQKSSQPTVRKSKRPPTSFTEISLLSDYTSDEADSRIILSGKYKSKSVLMIDSRANQIIAEFSTENVKAEVLSDDEIEENLKSKKRKNRHSSSSEFLNLIVASYSVNCNKTLIAIGTEEVDNNAAICFWDLRSNKFNEPINVFYDCHSEDVTSLSFHPTVPYALASGSTDALLCLYNLSNISDEYESIHQVLTLDSVSEIGFFGPSNSFMYTLSHMESLFLSRFIDGENIATFKDVRQSYNKGDIHSVMGDSEDIKIDYIIKGQYDNASGRLYLICGNQQGDIAIFNVSLEGLELTNVLSNVHSDIVRTVSWNPTNRIALSGGEDGNFAAWRC